MTKDAARRDEILCTATLIFDRGLTFGASETISVKTDDGWLMTPTRRTLGMLNLACLSKLDNNGNHVPIDEPSRESFPHMAMCGNRPKGRAIVHLHSTYSVAVSCCAGVDPGNVLPPVTAYYAMKIGNLPLVLFHPPGSPYLAATVCELAVDHHAVVLANHGPVGAGNALADPVYATEKPITEDAPL